MFYFTYGSNLDTEQMKRRCPGSLVRDVGRLKGYRLGFTCFSRGWGGGVAVLHGFPRSYRTALERIEVARH